MSGTTLKPTTLAAINDLDSMWNKLSIITAEIAGKELPRRPANSFTIAEYCDKYKVCEATARNRIRGLVTKHVLKVQYVQELDTNGRLRRTAIYTFTK